MASLVGMGVLATEMESSHLFTLARALGAADLTPVARASSGADVVKAGAVLALIGGEEGLVSEDAAETAERRAIDVGIRAAVELIRLEG